MRGDPEDGSLLPVKEGHRVPEITLQARARDRWHAKKGVNDRDSKRMMDRFTDTNQGL